MIELTRAFLWAISITIAIWLAGILIPLIIFNDDCLAWEKKKIRELLKKWKGKLTGGNDDE